MKKQEYVLFGLTDKELREAVNYSTGNRFRYVFDEHGNYMYSLVRLTNYRYRQANKAFKRLNKHYGYKLELFTKEEFGVE